MTQSARLRNPSATPLDSRANVSHAQRRRKFQSVRLRTAVRRQTILAFVEEAVDFVRNRTCVVFNDEAVLRSEGRSRGSPSAADHRLGVEVVVSVVQLVHLLNHAVVCALRHVYLFFNHPHHTRSFRLDQVQATLVVAKRYLRHVKPLAFVNLHLEEEDVRIEVELQLLIGVVDTQLLEGVDCKALKPKDVQHSDGCRALRSSAHTVDPSVDARGDVVKEVLCPWRLDLCTWCWLV